MALLKEGGSLDYERIRKLPLEERKHIIAKFTKEQIEEYFSKAPINEAHKPIIPVKVDYSMEDLLARGYKTPEQISEIIEKYAKMK